ncbi:uncharacterized protein [Watersipora subatra]
MLRKHFPPSSPASYWKKCEMCTIDRFMKSLRLTEPSGNQEVRTGQHKPSGTSDYGTCTCSGSGGGEADAKGCLSSHTWTDSSSCHGDYNSDSDLSVGSHSFRSEYEEGSTLRHASTDSDDDDSYFERFGKTLPDRSRILKYKRVTALIPGNNKNAYTPDEFTLNVVEDLYYTPVFTERTTMHASQVVSLGPHGAEFYDDEPALIYLPLGAHVDNPDMIVCLCSNTGEGDIPDWQRLPSSHYHYIAKENKVMIRAWHFSLYTAIVSCPYPELTKQVHVDCPTTLEISAVKGVKVHFPDHSLDDDFEARVKVFYSDDPTVPESSIDEIRDENALATPIIMLGPHGVTFNKDVLVQLPLPDCEQIIEKFGVDPKNSLTIYHSSTGELEDLAWEPCNVEYTVQQEADGSYVLVFPVRHFSWYKSVWGILASTMHNAKVGVSYFYPYIRFAMMCTAMMDETADTRSFGLEIIFYRSDKKLPEVGNYKHRVGGSLKPKFVRPGVIVIKLLSNDFEADTLHGENAQLQKEELEFHGLEFEKQFACVYKGEPVKKGVFGKCIIERKASGFNENIFEFNLTKCGNEGEFQFENTDGWSLMATRELASMLGITSDENWKTFAKHLGFTKHEIKNRLSSTTDPFALIMGAFQARGGSPDEFVQALYAVGREFRIGDSTPTSIGLNKSPSSSGLRTTSEDESDTSPGPSHSSTPSRKKRTYPGMNMFEGYSKKRQRSDISESAASSYSSYHEDQLHRTAKQPLGTNDLWKISQFINQHWKSLGRNLSVPEEDLNQVEHAHKDMRECAYQVLLKWKERFPQKCTFGILYVALCDSGLNSVATAHCISPPRSPK